jgi:hypothetical protein
MSEYTFFSSVYGTFFRIDHILGHKTTEQILRRSHAYHPVLISTLLISTQSGFRTLISDPKSCTNRKE